MTPHSGKGRAFHLEAGRGDVARDIDAEIAFHVQATVDDLVATGLSSEAAREEALRRLGDLRALRGRLADIDRRRLGRARRLERWLGIFSDARQGWRALVREPWFALIVVCTLALGIGVNASMFSLVDRLLLQPAPRVAHDPSLSLIYFQRETAEFGRVTNSSASALTFDALRGRRDLFDDVAAWWGNELSWGRGATARKMDVILVSPNYFSVLGVRPARGRFFTADEGRDDAPPAAVVTEAFADATWGSAAAALGQTLALGEHRYTVVGVAPLGFVGARERRVQVFVPLAAAAPETAGREWRTNNGMRWMELVARRRAGVTPSMASDAATTMYRQLNKEWHKSDSLASLVAGSIIPARRPDGTVAARISVWLVGVASLVLIVACANVANLLLARAQRRRREIAVRLALGVSRARLAAQFLVESFTLAALGGAIALVVAQWGDQLMRVVLLGRDAAAPGGGPNLRVVVFTIVVIVVTGVLAGAAPAIGASRQDVSDSLKMGAREGGPRRTRLRTGLIVIQATLSVILLVGAGLFVRSFQRASRLEIGFDANRVLVANIDLSGVARTEAAFTAFWREARDRVAALPGVEGASLAVTTPFYSQWTQDVFRQNGDSLRSGSGGEIYINAVEPGYFRTMGTRIVRGRPFNDADRPGSPLVAIVNEAMARQAWPGTDPIGECLRVRERNAPCATVVGVAANTHIENVERGDLAQYYVVMEQGAWDAPGMRALFVRVRGDATSLIPTVRRTVQQTVANLPYANVYSLREGIDPQIRPWRLGATMFGLFGALALVVAGLGMYSVVAYEVSQRTHEIGVRVALGARMPQLVRLVMRGGLQPAAIGVVLGLAIAFLGAGRMASLLFHTSPQEPVIYLVVAAALFAVAIAASLVPARRAVRLDAVEALRAE